MIAKLAYDASSFEQVARSIAAESDVGSICGASSVGMASGRNSSRSAKSACTRFFASIAEGRWSRKGLIRVLGKTLPDATNKVSELTSDFAVSSYLTDGQFGVGFDFLQIAQLSGLLHEIHGRCEAVSLSPRTNFRSG
jgi:hypothetical protein